MRACVLSCLCLCRGNSLRPGQKLRTASSSVWLSFFLVFFLICRDPEMCVRVCVCGRVCAQTSHSLRDFNLKQTHTLTLGAHTPQSFAAAAFFSFYLRPIFTLGLCVILFTTQQAVETHKKLKTKIQREREREKERGKEEVRGRDSESRRAKMKKEIQELIDRLLEAKLKVKHTHRRPCTHSPSHHRHLPSRMGAGAGLQASALSIVI